MPEHGRPVDPERHGQLLYGYARSVRGNQLSHLVKAKATLDYKGPNQRVSRI